jgi:integrase
MTSRKRSPVLAEDAGIDGLVWHDLRATYGTRLGEAGFNAYDIAKLMGHANISTSQRYVRNLPVGAGEAEMLKNQHRHSKTVPTLSGGDSGSLMEAVNS